MLLYFEISIFPSTISLFLYVFQGTEEADLLLPHTGEVMQKYV